MEEPDAMTWLKARQNERDPAAHVRRTQRWRRYNREWRLMVNGTLPGRGALWAIRRRERAICLAALFALTGCEHAVGDLARCYDGLFNSFCVVNTPPGTTATTGMPIVPGVAAVGVGMGTLMIGQGAIINGVATVIR